MNTEFRLGSIGAFFKELITRGVNERSARAIAFSTKRIRTSKYSPHQGAKEMARRGKQIAKGMITTTH